MTLAKIKQFRVSLKNLVVIAGLLVATVLPLIPAHTSAATLTNTYLRLNRMKAATSATYRLVFTTVGAGATSVAIDFNGADATTWTSSGAVNATQAVSVATCPGETGAAALPGAITAAGSGSTVTVSSVTALSATTAYCVDFTTATALTTPSAGEYHPTVTVGSDSTTIALRIIANDQITVSATVSATFSFTLSGTTDALGTLATSAPVTESPTPRTVTITTNAASGFFAWIKDANEGLVATAPADTISTKVGDCASYVANDEFFNLDADESGAGAGSAAIATKYDCAGASVGGDYDKDAFALLASGGAPNAEYIITLKNHAAASVTNLPSTTYADTITVVGAGNF